VCRKCHELCASCEGPGPSGTCPVCKGLREQGEGDAHGTCVASCSDKHYEDNDTNSETEKRLCRPCHKECNGCHGPSFVHCTNCHEYRIYTQDLTEEQLTNYSVTVNDTASNAL